MAVKVIRIINHITRDNAFDWTVTALKTVSNVSPIPPLTAATNVVLSILQIVSDVKTNRQGCIRLAQRATDLLVFLQSRMEGKKDAPKSLLNDIHEFEGTLSSIHKFMYQLSQMNRIRRGLEKAKIQDELIQHEQKLSGAERRFQLSSSIEMRYVLGAPSAASSNTSPRLPDQDQDVVTNMIGSPGASSSLGWSPFDSPVTRSEVLKRSCDHVDALELRSGSPLPATAVYTEEEEFLTSMSGVTDEFGFRKYHQSDVIIGKMNYKAVGWFSGTSEADVCGRETTIKRYDGEEGLTLKEWVRDIKMLRNLHHGSLPQIIGYSDRTTPTPFILLTSVQNRDLRPIMRSALTTQSLADCATMILRTYRDVASAIAHVQRQLSLSEDDTHHFIKRATYGVSNDNHVILGLPPPRKGWRVITCRSLETSLLKCVLHNLKELMNDETTTLRVGPSHKLKFRQLYGLLRSLLPQKGEGLHLPPELEDFLDDAGECGPLTLRALRAFNMDQLQFLRSWPDKSLVQPSAAGDYGYIPGGSTDLAKFVPLGNIQDSEYHKEITRVVGKAECTLFAPKHDPVICHRSSPPMATSSISDGTECWLIPLPPNRAPYVRVSYETRLNPVKHGRGFLVAHGASLASKHGVEAQDLILVTRSRYYQHYLTDGWSRSLRTRHAIELDSTAPDGPAFLVPVLPAEMLSEPSVVYLVTSSRPDFEPYVTDKPLSALPQDSTRFSLSFVGHHRQRQDELVDYVQLNVEDMES
ncbi:hypothetical protein BC826DRAFT_636167 [Russula brevipes]|nr:hypothetical protein BC826DRAFT_636167 [Russula brevipes]